MRKNDFAQRIGQDSQRFKKKKKEESTHLVVTSFAYETSFLSIPDVLLVALTLIFLGYYQLKATLNEIVSAGRV
jgi:hypothetical protein